MALLSISWSFGFDQNSSYFTNQNLDAASSGNFILIELDPNGNVDDWFINVELSNGLLTTSDDPRLGTSDEFGLDNNASNTNDPGTWTTGIPEPATALLLPLALGGLYVLRRRLFV